MVPEELKLAGKKAADALEALIGVVFEAAGDVATEAWLGYLGILPGLQVVRSPRLCPRHVAPSLSMPLLMDAHVLTGSHVVWMLHTGAMPSIWYKL